ncbi:MAG: ribonuclease E/G [Candidatus Puniceispirillaceae bacterium]
MIKTELIYDSTGRAALFEEGALVDYHKDSDDDNDKSAAYHIGGLFAARVSQVFTGQNRAECRLPNGQMASFRLSGKAKIVSGDMVFITLSAMMRQHKPWQAEVGLSRAGRLIVLNYGTSEIRVSQKSGGRDHALDPARKQALAAILPEGWGAIIKRAGMLADDAALQDEARQLLAPVTGVLGDLSLPAEPRMYYQGDEARCLLRLSANGTLAETQNEDAAWWQALEADLSDQGDGPYHDDKGFIIHIEQTQALIAIDVDSGTSRFDPATLARHAVPRIMAMIRLYALSGVIIVDLPRLKPSVMANCLDQFRKLAQKDIRHPDILGVTRAGLIEIVVRHRLAPLHDRLGKIGLARSAGKVGLAKS